jgi:hypothetical protein
VVLSWWALPRFGTVAMGWALVASALLYNAFKAVLVKSLLGDWPMGVQVGKLGRFALLSILVHFFWIFSRSFTGPLLASLSEAILQTAIFLGFVWLTDEVPDFKVLLKSMVRLFNRK